VDDFLRFVAERHRVWERRQAGAAQPWTDDPILASRKFTNVFRVLDPGTQYVLTDLFEPELDERDRLLRAFLYRHTGRIESWQHLELICGLPTHRNLEAVREAWHVYRGGVTLGGRGSGHHGFAPKKDTVRSFERSLFTSAYLVFPQSATPGTDKLDSILDLTERVFTPGSPDDIMPDWERARTQAQRYKILRRNKGVGDFMSMQVLADWTYTQDRDLEDEFLQPGPGSVKGAAQLFPGEPTMTVVRRVVDAVRNLPDVPRVGYRVPSLMDIGSNLLCEWSKYARFREKPVPASKYKPAHPGVQPAPVLPSYYTEGADLL
jgi:hypothetical protein